MKLKYEAMVWCKNIITQRIAKKLQGNLRLKIDLYFFSKPWIGIIQEGSI